MGNFTFVNKAPNIIEKKHQTLTNFSFFTAKSQRITKNSKSL